MQITVRPGGFVNAALNLVNAPQFAGCRDECANFPFVAMQQMSRTDAADLANVQRVPGTERDCRPIGIQESGTMDFPIQPLVRTQEHADCSARKSKHVADESSFGCDGGTIECRQDGHSCPSHGHETRSKRKLLYLDNRSIMRPCSVNISDMNVQSPEIAALDRAAITRPVSISRHSGFG